MLYVTLVFIARVWGLRNGDRGAFSIWPEVVSDSAGRHFGAGVLRGAALGVAAQTLAEEVSGPLPALRDLLSGSPA